MISICSTNILHVVIEVMGFWSPGNDASVGDLTFVPLTRVVDTRAGSRARSASTPAPMRRSRPVNERWAAAAASGARAMASAA